MVLEGLKHYLKKHAMSAILGSCHVDNFKNTLILN